MARRRETIIALHLHNENKNNNSSLFARLIKLTIIIIIKIIKKNTNNRSIHTLRSGKFILRDALPIQRYSTTCSFLFFLQYLIINRMTQLTRADWDVRMSSLYTRDARPLMRMSHEIFDIVSWPVRLPFSVICVILLVRYQVGTYLPT